MRSSTSSSRAIYFKIFLVTTLGMALSLVLVRLFTYANDARGETILERVYQAREQLPRVIAEQDDLVMVFGSSMVEAGFSPRQFDRQLGQRGIAVKSFNFGFGGLNPYFQDFFARRIRDDFEAGGRRLELAVLEFNPFQTTTSRYRGALPALDSFVTMLATPEEMWEIAEEDPERGALMFNIRYLRDNISAEMVTYFLGRPLHDPGPPESDLTEDEELVERREELGEKLNAQFEEDYPDYDDEEWHYPWQGGGTIPEERSQETIDMLAEYYRLANTPKRMEDDKLDRIDCCDIEELHFEEELIAAYVRLVKVFQEFSDHVDIIMLPRNTEWIHYTPEARARLDEVLARIHRETGLAVKDFQDVPEITPEMFSDTTHLGRYSGDLVFTELLVEEYAPLLRGGG